MSTFLKRLLGVGFSLALTFFLLYIVIRVYDGILVRQNSSQLVGVSPLTLYPFTGMQLAANYAFAGPAPGEPSGYSHYEWESGDHGFFVDFDLDNPPAKAANEFRVILIGGSGAQGFGATTMDRMMFRQLQGLLDERFNTPDLKVTIINLAMASSFTQQNFIALNLWAHPLEPDLIISFSGANDFIVPLQNNSNAPYLYYRVMAATDAAGSALVQTGSKDYKQAIPGLSWYYENYPGFMNFTIVGEIVTQFYTQGFLEAARERYIASFGFKSDLVYGTDINGKLADLVPGLVIPFYTNALKSIKRDFMGIPMLIVTQPADYSHLGERGVPSYHQFIDESWAELQGYMNDDWYHLDLQRHWEENGYLALPNYGSVHFGDEGQRLIAEKIAEVLVPLIAEKAG